MNRCRLISPTQLLLEHPMLSPVKESEFYIIGVKEHAERLKERFFAGAVLGFLAGGMFVWLLTLVERGIR